VYYGILHNHSIISDGAGDPAYAYKYARDVADLDFFSLADHAESVDSEEWISLGMIADGFNKNGSFIAFRGFEWSHPVYGHVAVIDSRDICRATEPGTDTFQKLLRFLNTRDCFAFFNHPGRQDSTGTEFDHFASPGSMKIVGMELWNKNDGFGVYYYNDGYVAGDGNKGFYDEALAAGWRIGASGSDDNHTATYGTDVNYRMAVIADSLTRRSIRDAIRARRFFSTSDKNLKISFEVNGTQMGSYISPGICDARISAYDTETFVKIELVGNGKVVRTWDVKSCEPAVNISFDAEQGEYYYIRLLQADGDEAVSSPIWIDTTNGRFK
jgi:hypothetical protein